MLFTFKFYERFYFNFHFMSCSLRVKVQLRAADFPSLLTTRAAAMHFFVQFFTAMHFLTRLMHGNEWMKKKKRSLNCVIVIYEELFSVQHCNEPPLRLCSIVGSFALTQPFFATLLFFLCEKEEKKKMEHHRANVTTRNNLIEHLWVFMQNRNKGVYVLKCSRKKLDNNAFAMFYGIVIGYIQCI